MPLNTPTDLHRRYFNLQAASQAAKAKEHPLIAWPQDPTILKLDDLPHLTTMPPVTKFRLTRAVKVTDDEVLRSLIIEGFAYARLAKLTKPGNPWIVAEFEVLHA